MDEKNMSVPEKLREYKQLYDDGIITEEEYAAKKEYLLSVDKPEEVTDNGGFLWGLLGFFVPVIGLVLFLIYKDSRPKTAKAVGIGAIAGAAVFVVFCIIVIIGVAISAGAASYQYGIQNYGF